MKTTSWICIVAIAIYAVLALLQLWFSAFDAVIFGKISITFGIVIGALVIATLIRREYISDKKMKEKGFLD